MSKELDKTPQENLEEKDICVVDLFKCLTSSKDMTSVPSVYGTKNWAYAAVSELGPQANISPGNTGNLVIQLPDGKEISVTQQEFWEISCLSACEKHNSYYFNNEAEIWKYEKPWHALQEFNLKHCRAKLTKKQEETICKVLEAYSNNNEPLPFISSMAFGWPWMFESAPGVWPPEGIINPRSVMYDPLLGIMVFKDVLDYLKSKKAKELEILAFETSMCTAKHVINNSPSHLEAAKEVLGKSTKGRIEKFVQICEQALSPYSTRFDEYLGELDEKVLLECVSIFMLGAHRLTQAMPELSLSQELQKRTLLKAYSKLVL